MTQNALTHTGSIVYNASELTFLTLGISLSNKPGVKVAQHLFWKDFELARFVFWKFGIFSWLVLVLKSRMFYHLKHLLRAPSWASDRARCRASPCLLPIAQLWVHLEPEPCAVCPCSEPSMSICLSSWLFISIAPWPQRTATSTRKTAVQKNKNTHICVHTQLFTIAKVLN